MTAVSAPAVSAALDALIDYAGLFPPAQLDVEAAVREYFEAKGGRYAWMLGRFISRCSQLSRVLAALPPQGAPIGISLILDRGIADLEWAAAFRRDTRRATLGALEIALPQDSIEAFARAREKFELADIPAFVETVPSAMPVLARERLGAKIRCGGLAPDAYPLPETLAAFVKAAVDARVPFKATAGLHHPVRHFNREANVTMHGFLNVLAVTALARAGEPLTALTGAAACEDASQFRLGTDAFTYRDKVFDVRFMREVRRENFIAYGSCSFSEPVEDLRALSILS